MARAWFEPYEGMFIEIVNDDDVPQLDVLEWEYRKENQDD